LGGRERAVMMPEGGRIVEGKDNNKGEEIIIFRGKEREGRT
jgi:hypothetical protein